MACGARALGGEAGGGRHPLLQLLRHLSCKTKKKKKKKKNNNKKTKKKKKKKKRLLLNFFKLL